MVMLRKLPCAIQQPLCHSGSRSCTSCSRTKACSQWAAPASQQVPCLTPYTPHSHRPGFPEGSAPGFVMQRFSSSGLLPGGPAPRVQPAALSAAQHCHCTQSCLHYIPEQMKMHKATAHLASSKEQWSWDLVRYAGAEKAVRMQVIFLAESERLFPWAMWLS